MRAILKISCFIGGFFAFFDTAAAAATIEYTVKPEQSPVTFLAVGKPGFLKIRGEGGKLAGKATLAGSTLSGRFEVDLAPFKTGIDLRDEHMKEKYLEVPKHPKATLTLTSTSLPATSGKIETSFNGTLTLKGVEKPVTGELSADLSAQEASGEATMKVKITDYPIDVPVYLGVTVAESVEVKVAFQAVGTPQAAATAP